MLLTVASSWPVLMNSCSCVALPNDFGFPLRPRQMAFTIELLPEPFGPRITFRCGPGRKETEVYC